MIGFGYKVETLFQTALVNPKSYRNFSIRVLTENVDTPLYVMNGDNGAQTAAEPRSRAPTSSAA